MTPLARILSRRIAANGPVSVAEYMAECLLHPKYGYYATRDPLGQVGDFTTAPEISQMFGECLGLCLIQSWMDQGKPERIILAELGPGRGTLMADVLRTAHSVPGFLAAVEIHLVEASTPLTERQAATLSGHQPTWHENLQSVPTGPLFLLANEFFDALPIRQFVRDQDGWRERQIGLIDGALQFGLSDPAPVAQLAHRLGGTETGSVVEFCPALPGIAAELGQRIEANGGVALVIDYGDWRSVGDTLQAVRNHTYDPPLAHPGEADLTAHVDFEAIARSAAPAKTTAMVSQGELLERLGITVRARALAQNLRGNALEQHVAAHRRLTHPDEMGRVFKSLAIHPQSTPAPPGYL